MEQKSKKSRKKYLALPLIVLLCVAVFYFVSPALNNPKPPNNPSPQSYPPPPCYLGACILQRGGAPALRLDYDQPAYTGYYASIPNYTIIASVWANDVSYSTYFVVYRFDVITQANQSVFRYAAQTLLSNFTGGASFAIHLDIKNITSVIVGQGTYYLRMEILASHYNVEELMLTETIASIQGSPPQICPGPKCQGPYYDFYSIHYLEQELWP